MMIIETCPKCGHDLMNEALMTYPPIPRKVCYNCGWSWEGKREEIVRVPFGGNANTRTTVTTLSGSAKTQTTVATLNDYLNVDSLKGSLVDNFEQSACANCSNNPKNGGSGICHCTLGLPKVTC